MSPQRPPSLLVSAAPPASPIPSTSLHLPGSSNNSPFRYIQLQEKHASFRDPLVRPALSHPLDGAPSESSSPVSSPITTSTVHSPLHHTPRHPPPRTRAPISFHHTAHPAGFRIPDKVKPWLGIASWVATSIGFLLAIAFWKKEVFTGLDQLSLHLQSLGLRGHSILFCLIFITTIPPFPLYSTLIVLSGYTFGTWTGAAISYSAALSGAIVVFLVSRRYLRDSLSRLLNHTVSLKRVVRAIEKRPRLLLLIRIAPYPYNLMNVLLAASHTLSFSTYFWCTALSLCKVLIHTSVGSGLHSFSGHHLPNNNNKYDAGKGEGKDGVGWVDEDENRLGKTWTVVGIVLCIGILVYLSVVARRAVEDELEDDQSGLYVEEGRRRPVVVAVAVDEDELEAEMREVPRSTTTTGS